MPLRLYFGSSLRNFGMQGASLDVDSIPIGKVSLISLLVSLFSFEGLVGFRGWLMIWGILCKLCLLSCSSSMSYWLGLL